MGFVKQTGGRVLAIAVVFLHLTSLVAQGQSLPAPGQAVQVAVVSDSVAGSYLNLSSGGGRPVGQGVDGDGAPALQQASMTATFSNFALNGIPFDQWQACRASRTVDDCLATLGTTLLEKHPGAIGGDVFAFDVSITNNSPSAVLTTFAFQSKFSESPALGSRIGDKLFSAERVSLTSSAPRPLIGVKKNGTSNGLFGGKVKFICINSSDDYPPDLNLGDANETLECAGGRTFDRVNNRAVLQAADDSIIDGNNLKLPKGLLPGETMTIRIVLDAGTDDGALARAHGGATQHGFIGPLKGTLKNAGQFRDPDKAAECLELNVQSGDNVVEVVNFGDVKIIRDANGNCNPSFDPFNENQFLTIPRRHWGFTDILDTRDDYLPLELPTVLTGATGKFSFLDFGHLRPNEMNFFEILRGFGEHGTTLDPSCKTGGSRQGTCGGAAYAPLAEFYAIANGKLTRQEVAGVYGTANYGTNNSNPSLTATVNTSTQTDCRPNRAVKCKTTNPFEVPGQRNPGSAIGASAEATFSDVVVISDDPSTIPNEGGRAGGDKVQFTVNIKNTSPAGSNIYLTSFNFQTKERGLTDINDRLDGTSIQGRQDMRLGATLNDCMTPDQARCFDTELGIGRFPNVIGNSLLSAVAISGLANGKLSAVKKNGTFQPLMRADGKAENFICIKSGAPAADQDADETCFGEAGKGLLPGESQPVRLELDYGDFRGLILRIAPGTLTSQAPPFGLLQLGGDFDCRDQRRLPYCHPDLVGQDWFTEPTMLEHIEFVTVHQPGDAPTVMNFAQNFGIILAMAGFIPTAEFWQGGTQMQVKGHYLNLPGGATNPPPPPPPPSDNQLPTAVIATPICKDLTCTFDGSGSFDPDGTIVRWSWTFLNGETQVGDAEGAKPQFTFSAAGTFGVRLLVTDDKGGTGMANTTVTVTAPPAPSGLTFSGSASRQGSTWSAIVNVSGGLANTLISGAWNIGGTPNSCTTNSTGACTITRSGIPNRTGSATWTHAGTGQTVTITKP